MLLDHFGGMLELLGPQRACIVLDATHEGADRTAQWAQGRALEIFDYAGVRSAGLRFAQLVSNHPGNTTNCERCGTQVCVHHPQGRFEIEAIAHLQIRMMYSLGKRAWNFRAWNDRYDLILTFGPRHARELAQSCQAAIAQVGYPRHDRFHRGMIDRDAMRARLGLRAGMPIVVWLPTWHATSSIDAFARAVAGLSDCFVTVVQAHPNTYTDEPERMELLRSLPFDLVLDPPIDSVELVALADFVLCDYGGSAFGALYQDKNLLLLDTPAAATDPLVGNDSFDVELRNSIPSLDPDRVRDLLPTLLTPEHWTRQAPVRARLRTEFFAPFYGCSTEVAVTAIEHAERIVAAHRGAQR